LDNSGEGSELEYVQANVSCGSALLFDHKDEDTSGSCWTADDDCPVVLLKAGTTYYLHVNVSNGDVLCLPDTEQQGLSHASCFVCVCPD
jgi:hypothetical protein